MNEYNYNKLRGRIRECGYRTESEFARQIRMTPASLSLKLNSRLNFTQDDILTIIGVLDIGESDVGKYFFCCHVHNFEPTPVPDAPE